MKIKKNWAVGLIVMLLVLACIKEDTYSLNIKEFPNRTNDFTLWQLEQFKGLSQMGYILRTDDNKLIVIDGGVSETTNLVLDYINQLGGTVNYWVLTHPHKDHVGVFKQVLSQKIDIVIENVIHSRLDISLVQKHEPISYEYVKDFYSLLDISGLPILDISLGVFFDLGEGVNFNVLGIKNPGIVSNLVNNSSLVFQISSASKKVLFTGDLGIEGGERLLRDNEREIIESTHVQMSHHGQDGVSKEFYEVVNAEVALWPTPLWLWENNQDAKGFNSGPWKTLIVKKWMYELGIAENIVAGIEGTSQID